MANTKLGYDSRVHTSIMPYHPFLSNVLLENIAITYAIRMNEWFKKKKRNWYLIKNSSL